MPPVLNLAPSLQAAERRAQEAEEEQLRSEQEAAAAAAELRGVSGGGGAGPHQVETTALVPPGCCACPSASQSGTVGCRAQHEVTNFEHARRWSDVMHSVAKADPVQIARRRMAGEQVTLPSTRHLPV